MRTSSKQLVLVAGFLGVLVSLAQVGAAQSANPLIGTWKMNAAKSKATPGPVNKSGLVKIEVAGAGVKYTVDSVTAAGVTQHWGFTTNFDGKDSPVTGNSPYGDTITVTRIDANTTRNVNKKAGKTTATQTTVVSSDGKTRTVTTKGTNAMGQPVDSVTVYDRQ